MWFRVGSGGCVLVCGVAGVWGVDYGERWGGWCCLWNLDGGLVGV